MYNKPLISIITPSFNQDRFLEETIKSVLNQDYPNLEYIVIDGASTDDSIQIIKRYANDIDYWISEPDQGQADAINKGFNKASGEFVAWLNSDDYYLPGTISAAIDALQACDNCGFVYGDVLAVDEDGTIFNLLKYGDWGLEGLMQFKIIGQPSVFMRNSVLKQAGFLEKRFNYMLDHNLWLKIARISEIKYIPETWSAARYHEGAKNLSQASAFGEEAYKVVRLMEEREDFKSTLEKNKNKIMGGAHWINAWYLSEAGESLRSLTSYIRCFIKDPKRAIRDWKRIVVTFLSLLGIKKIQRIYTRYQYKRYNEFSKNLKK